MSEISYEFEKSLCPENTCYCGVDEAGRGPLVGRVYAAAVILPENYPDIPELKGLNDSKKLSEKKREQLAEHIKHYATAFAIGFASVEEIEEINILSAAMLAMNRAIASLEPSAAFALIDGNCCKSIKLPCKTVVGGDAKCPSIAAASILAKTARDAYCKVELDVKYPEYGFAIHKGYGTKAHYEAVDTYGLCPEHRPSFFKKYFAKKQGINDEDHEK